MDTRSSEMEDIGELDDEMGGETEEGTVLYGSWSCSSRADIVRAG